MYTLCYTLTVLPLWTKLPKSTYHFSHPHTRAHITSFLLVRLQRVRVPPSLQGVPGTRRCLLNFGRSLLFSSISSFHRCRVHLGRGLVQVNLVDILLFRYFVSIS